MRAYSAYFFNNNDKFIGLGHNWLEKQYEFGGIKRPGVRLSMAKNSIVVVDENTKIIDNDGEVDILANIEIHIRENGKPLPLEKDFSIQNIPEHVVEFGRYAIDKKSLPEKERKIIGGFIVKAIIDWWLMTKKTHDISYQCLIQAQSYVIDHFNFVIGVDGVFTPYTQALKILNPISSKNSLGYTDKARLYQVDIERGIRQMNKKAELKKSA